MKKGLNHWECYANLYGREITRIVKNYIQWGSRKFYNYSINLPINEVINALPACSIKLDSSVYDVSGAINVGRTFNMRGCHIKGKGINKTIIGE